MTLATTAMVVSLVALAGTLVALWFSVRYRRRTEAAAARTRAAAYRMEQAYAKLYPTAEPGPTTFHPCADCRTPVMCKDTGEDRCP